MLLRLELASRDEGRSAGAEVLAVNVGTLARDGVADGTGRDDFLDVAITDGGRGIDDVGLGVGALVIRKPGVRGTAGVVPSDFMVERR